MYALHGAESPFMVVSILIIENCMYIYSFFLQSVTSPYDVTGLPREVKYTFTVTARNSYGSGAAAPWQTLYFGALSK